MGLAATPELVVVVLAATHEKVAIVVLAVTEGEEVLPAASASMEVLDQMMEDIQFMAQLNLVVRMSEGNITCLRIEMKRKELLRPASAIK